MHISEGVLSAPVLLTGAAATFSGVAIGLKKMKDKDIPRTAMVSAALFIVSLIHVPLGPANLHLTLNGIAGILLGWEVFLAFFMALLLQSILFQFGGVTALGMNVVNMALPALICYYLFKFILKIDKENTMVIGVGAFICGALAIFLAVILMAISLVFTGESFLEIAKLAVVSQLPLMIIEGLISAFCVIFINKVKPELLKGGKSNE
jgi:cobalt/nickel transport system permease protein